ncbi:MAG: hypothetical protein KatS3mg109_1960 [Pirellulaceae bacterium]|nr:MAG: hypothetical protein KatS3mg109_1960 [Pirellulaceae bacterium]GIW95289.1 MAG: hypothetical protein KatS3mg110_3330 [Pirellulaceae bacterium]
MGRSDLIVKFVACPNNSQVYRVEITVNRSIPYPDGPVYEAVHIDIYKTPQSKVSEEDWHYDTLAQAMTYCEREYGIKLTDWTPIPVKDHQDD